MLDRYLRNARALSEADQSLLASKRALVAGCGGLGGYVIECLARIGVGKLRLVDGDVFEASNLNRQLFSSEMNLGKPKVLAAQHRIMAINPLVEVETVFSRFEDADLVTLFGDCDVVVDALDNIPSRLRLQQKCEEAGVTLVHGAVAGWWGQVCVIRPGEDLLNILYGSSMRDVGEEKQIGTLSFSPAVVGALQAAEVVKLLLNKPTMTRELLSIDLLHGAFERVKL